MSVIEEYARDHPEEVVRRGGETFVRAEAAGDLIDRAERAGVAILGLEGFLISEDAIYPALSRIADFSSLGSSDPGFVQQSAADARRMLAGEWSLPPGPDDQIHSEATGRYMLAVVLDERP